MRRHIRTIFSIFLIGALFSIASVSFAAVCEGQDDCKSKIKEYEEKLNNARTQTNNLSSQLKFMDTKIELAQFNIKKTEGDIDEAQIEIDKLSNKIDELNTSLDHVSRVLLEKIVDGYKRREMSMLELFFAPDNSSFTNRLQYIQKAEENDQMLALRTQQIKNNFVEQKSLREVKKEELEELENQLKKQKADLDSEKAQKTELLQQTKNDEKKYQQLLAQALSEFQAINAAVESGQKVGPVQKGDPIALVGNTGWHSDPRYSCSTNKHLHFEVRQDNQWVNPHNYVGGDKSWRMPLNDPIIITQEFGHTPYSWRYAYSGGVHTGLDMVSESSDVIYAPFDGTLYTSSQNCAGGPAIIKIKYIDHGNGLKSFFLHVQ